MLSTPSYHTTANISSFVFVCCYYCCYGLRIYRPRWPADDKWDLADGKFVSVRENVGLCSEFLSVLFLFGCVTALSFQFGWPMMKWIIMDEQQSVSESAETSSLCDEERAKKLFQACDGDGDGYIDRWKWYKFFRLVVYLMFFFFFWHFKKKDTICKWR